MIYPYQEAVYNGIKRAMAVHHYSQGLTIPVKPRTHTLVIGPTGTGKTFLANEAINSANWGCYHINCSMWLVSGSRGDSHTFQDIVEWVAREPVGRPLAIVLDEIDKADSKTSDWYRNVRSEMFSLLDGHTPSGSYDLGIASGPTVEKRISKLFIVGCGAFQDLEDAPQKGMGFNPDDKTARGLNDLSKSLSRELLNRFSDRLLRLPKLTSTDYTAITEAIYNSSGPDIRPIIKSISESRIASAIENQTGARFGEVLAAEVIEAILTEHEPEKWAGKASAVVDLDSDDYPW